MFRLPSPPILQDFKKIPLHMGTLIHYKLAFEKADQDQNGYAVHAGHSEQSAQPPSDARQARCSCGTLCARARVAILCNSALPLDLSGFGPAKPCCSSFGWLLERSFRSAGFRRAPLAVTSQRRPAEPHNSRAEEVWVPQQGIEVQVQYIRGSRYSGPLLTFSSRCCNRKATQG